MSFSLNYPRLSYITAITNALNATVTFQDEHDFTPGQIVSFRVGKAFGMSEINNQKAKVLISYPNSIVIPVNTLTWTPFSLANLNDPGTSPPVCVPSCTGVTPFLENPEMNTRDAFDTRRA